MATPVLPAVASLALAPVIEGRPRPGVVLGSADAAVWLGIDDGVLVIGTGDAVRLPNGIAVAAPSRQRPLRTIRHGDTATVGDGAVSFPSLHLPVVRWWDPVPPVAAADSGSVLAAVASLQGVVPVMEDHGLRRGLADGDDRAALEAARSLIGRGDGLTPEGDDLVAGTVAGFLLIGRSLGALAIAGVVAAVEGPILDHVSRATTAFSAALLAHAFRGEVAVPAAALVSALAGWGDPAGAARELMKVGHSSGPALAAGIIAGVGAAIERSI